MGLVKGRAAVTLTESTHTRSVSKGTFMCTSTACNDIVVTMLYLYISMSRSFLRSKNLAEWMVLCLAKPETRSAQASARKLRATRDAATRLTAVFVSEKRKHTSS